MSTSDFLVEIGTEELPPKALRALIDAFSSTITAQLSQLGLAFGDVSSFAAPRRLAVVISDLQEQTPSKEIVA